MRFEVDKLLQDDKPLLRNSGFQTTSQLTRSFAGWYVLELGLGTP